MAVKSVITALIMKAIIAAGPARPIAGPVRTNIAPPTNPAIPIIVISTRPNERTRCCSLACSGDSGDS